MARKLLENKFACTVLRARTANVVLGFCFNDKAYYCVDCNIDMCNSCQPSHSTLHATSIVRVTFLPWPPRPGVAETTASCSECSLDIKCRLECSDCSSCLCQECSGFEDRRKKWYDHRSQHQRIKGFICLCSPLEEVSPSTSGQCDCLTVRGCISHCYRCHRGKTRQIFQLSYDYELNFPLLLHPRRRARSK